MKVVLLSVIMVITVVHVSPMCTRVSNPNSTKQTRRCIPIKEEKYTTRLNTDDHFSERERKTKQVHKLPNWKTHDKVYERKKFANIRGGLNCKMMNNHNDKMSTRSDSSYGARGSFEHTKKTETGQGYPSKRGVLRFRSPEQLQEYLFSEAGNAKHILRGGPALYGSSTSFGRDEFIPRNLNYVDSYGEKDTTGRNKETWLNVSNVVEPDWTGDVPRYGKSNVEFVPTEKYHNWKNREHGPIDNDWFSPKRSNIFGFKNNYGNRRNEMRLYERNREDYSLSPDSIGDRNYLFRDKHPYYNPLDVPYLYPPPWYGARTPFFIPKIKFAVPYDRKVYETPSYMDEHPRKTKEKKEDVPAGDLAKLKQMVDELDAMSEDIKEMSVSATKTTGERKEKEQNDTVADVKEKIDKIIIPILNKISKDLNGTSSQIANGAPVKRVEIVESDAKKEKDKEKDRERDKDREKDRERDKDREKDRERERDKDKDKDKEKDRERERDKDKDKDKEKDRERDKDKEKDKEKEVDTKKDYPCKIDGIWTATSEALQLNISTLPNMTVKVSIMSENSKKGSDINKDWTISGLTLASFGGPFMFAAVYPEKKKLANFIGQCRTCREEDIIFGLWTFSTAGRDCAEMFTTVETKIDVFRREKTQQTKTEKSTKALTES